MQSPNRRQAHSHGHAKRHHNHSASMDSMIGGGTSTHHNRNGSSSALNGGVQDGTDSWISAVQPSRYAYTRRDSICVTGYIHF